MDPHPVLQVGQVRGGSLPPGHRVAQRLEEPALQDGIAVGVLGQQPRRAGAVPADQRLARPASRGEQLAEPPGVLLVDPVPFRGDLVGDPVARPGDHVADPLILIAPGQQFPPEFFVHHAIAPPAGRSRHGPFGIKAFEFCRTGRGARYVPQLGWGTMRM
jgi:hypothetical protein